MASCYRSRIAIELERNLVLQLALFWKMRTSGVSLRVLLNSIFTLTGMDMAEANKSLREEGMYYPKSFGDTSVCWNCGRHEPTSKHRPVLLSCCLVCDSNKEKKIAELWWIKSFLSGYLVRFLTELQIETLLLRAVRLATGTSQEI